MDITRMSVHHGIARDRETEDSAFEIEILPEIASAGRVQLQLDGRPRAGSAVCTVDWGDGTEESRYEGSPRFGFYHDFASPGTFTVRLGSGFAWFRLVTCYAISSQGRVSVYKPSIRPVRWSDFVEDCSATYGYWSGSSYGTKGVWGSPIPWGRRVAKANACYAGSRNIAGPVPPWNDAIEDCSLAYQATGVTGLIPRWPAAMRKCNSTYSYCASLEGAWTDDPAELMPECEDHGGCVTDASAALRGLFARDWGGTRTA